MKVGVVKDELMFLGKAPPQCLNVKDWVESVRVLRELKMQRQLVSFLLISVGILTAATLALFFLQGFHIAGFDLGSNISLWLGPNLFGEIGALALMVYGYYFRRNH